MHRNKWQQAYYERVKDKPEFKQKRLNSQRRWTENNPEYRKLWRAKLRAEAVALLGGKCSDPLCQWVNVDGTQGCTDERCLQIDHVNSGGRREFFLLGSGDAVYRKVIRTKGVGYQLLCANCNWIKRHNNQEWPALKLRLKGPQSL